MGAFGLGNVVWEHVQVNQAFCKLLTLMLATRSREGKAISKTDVNSIKDELLLCLGLPYFNDTLFLVLM